jgi:hypothetical protein
MVAGRCNFTPSTRFRQNSSLASFRKPVTDALELGLGARVPAKLIIEVSISSTQPRPFQMVETRIRRQSDAVLQ